MYLATCSHRNWKLLCKAYSTCKCYLGIVPLKCHFCLSIQVSSFLSCWCYLSNYTPLCIIKQNPAERVFVLIRYLIELSFYQISPCTLGSRCPCKNNLPWLENSLLQHLGRPQHIPLVPIALTLIVWLLGFSFCQASRLVVASKLIVLSLQQAFFQYCLQAFQLTYHMVKHLLCCKMWAFIIMNFVKKCFIIILSSFWTRQWPPNIKEPCCSRWGCLSVQSDVF